MQHHPGQSHICMSKRLSLLWCQGLPDCIDGTDFVELPSTCLLLAKKVTGRFFDGIGGGELMDSNASLRCTPPFINA